MDQASYMLSAFPNLKQMYSTLRHVTCIVHALHRVCVPVPVEYFKANDFISEIKKVLLKVHARIQVYRDITGQPIITRWGTWLRAAVFYCENFNKMELFLSHFSESESETIGKAQKLVKDNYARNELYATNSVKFLVDKITKLETRNYRVRTNLLHWFQ